MTANPVSRARLVGGAAIALTTAWNEQSTKAYRDGLIFGHWQCSASSSVST